MDDALHADPGRLVAGSTARSRASLASPRSSSRDQVVPHGAVCAVGRTVALVAENRAFLAPVGAVQVEVLDAADANCGGLALQAPHYIVSAQLTVPAPVQVVVLVALLASGTGQAPKAALDRALGAGVRVQVESYVAHEAIVTGIAGEAAAGRAFVAAAGVGDCVPEEVALAALPAVGGVGAGPAAGVGLGAELAGAGHWVQVLAHQAHIAQGVEHQQG